jgi:chemotaxis protein methyltransferase CheR
MGENNTIIKIQKFIEELCGISLNEEKQYLIESRLARLLVEYDCDDFEQFYKKINMSKDEKLKEKIIDAITTNETQWFRDIKPWIFLEKNILPEAIESVRDQKIKKFRIWSAASSTGQEAYSTSICINEYLIKNNIKDVTLENFEIIGTDISKEVLNIAKEGRYNAISVMRGLDKKYLEKYFEKEGRVFKLNDEIKNIVKFTHFNLLNDFSSLGKFDLIFCRYVLIYFSKELKKNILEKISNSLDKNGFLVVGASEILPDYSNYFKQIEFEKGVYYCHFERGDFI